MSNHSDYGLQLLHKLFVISAAFLVVGAVGGIGALGALADATVIVAAGVAEKFPAQFALQFLPHFFKWIHPILPLLQGVIVNSIYSITDFSAG